MNTMVGMQATSLHTPTEDSLSELMKSDNVEAAMAASGAAAASGTASSAGTDDLELMEDDLFDADELLKSPLFNDSAEKLVNEDDYFGVGGNAQNSDVSEAGLQQQQQPQPPPPQAEPGGGLLKREFVPMGLRRSDDTSAMKQRQLQLGPQSALNGMASGNIRPSDGDVVYGDMSSSQNGNNPNPSFGMEQQQQQQQQQQLQLQQQQQFQQQQNYQSMDTSSRSFQNNGGMDTSQQGNMQNSFTGMNPNQIPSYGGEANQAMDSSARAGFAPEDGGVKMMNPYLDQGNNSHNSQGFLQSTPERTGSGTSSYGSDVSPAPRAPSSILDMSQGSQQMLSGMAADPQNEAPTMFRRSAPQRSQTYHPGAPNPLQMMQQQQQEQQQQQQQPSPSDGNQLQMMQQHLQQMQDLEQLEHQIQHQQQQGMGNNNQNNGMGLSQSMHLPARSVSCGPMGQERLGPNTFHGSTGFSGGGNDLQAMQAHLMNNASGAGGSVTVNDAMEKLCVSMKRSAMSRTLVKQFSSSGRGVSRSNSGAMMGMARELSNRGIRRSSSSRGGMQMDDGSHRSVENRPAAPIRRVSNTKHQLQRGVHRHASGGLVGVNGHQHQLQGNGGNGSNLSFQIDGRNLGSL